MFLICSIILLEKWDFWNERLEKFFQKTVFFLNKKLFPEKKKAGIIINKRR